LRSDSASSVGSGPIALPGLSKRVYNLTAYYEHNGFEVEVPKQDCCGLPLQSNGLFDDARGYVGRLAAKLAQKAGITIALVTSRRSPALERREGLSGLEEFAARKSQQRDKEDS